MNKIKNYELEIGFLILILVSSVVAFRSIEKSPGEWFRHNDFAHYYITSERLAQGINPYLNNLSNSYESHGFVNFPPITQATNPPALATLFIPFSVLPPKLSFLIWTGVQLLSLFATIILILKFFDIKLSSPRLIVLFLGGLLTYPTMTHLEHGQTQLLIGLLLVMGLFSIVNGSSPKMGPLLWGLATSLKLFTWPLLILSYGALGLVGIHWFLIGFFVLTIPSLLSFGPGIFADYWQLSVPFILETVSKFNSSNSFSGAIIYTVTLLNFDKEFILSISKGVKVISPLILLLISVFIAKRYSFKNTLNESSNRIPSLLVPFSLIIIASLLFSPTTWAHYYTVAFIPLLFTLCIYIKTKSNALHPAKLIIAYTLIALTQGRIRTAGIEWEFVSSWMGVVALLYLASLFYKISGEHDKTPHY